MPDKRKVGVPLPSKATPPSGLIWRPALPPLMDNSFCPTRKATLAFRAMPMMVARSILKAKSPVNSKNSLPGGPMKAWRLMISNCMKGTEELPHGTFSLIPLVTPALLVTVMSSATTCPVLLKSMVTRSTLTRPTDSGILM